MRKLTLSIEALQVESFHAVEPTAPRGTVVGHTGEDLDGSCKPWCSQDTVCNTCPASCNGTCYNSCGASCAGTCNASCPASCGCTYDTDCNCQTFETCPGAQICM
jgi:hypothetical protein